MNSSARASNFGIIAMSAYVPSCYVDQQDLEDFDGVSRGRYTIGIGQTKMSFCSDREDVVSISMNAVEKLMETHQIKYEDIGRLDVGTESLIDKCKSVKSYLMLLFQKSGNYNVEGVDNINACYGGTAALFNAVNWLESSAWDGEKYALVVMADIAVYDSGNARCTGGVGAVAALLGPNAAVVLENNCKVSCMNHAYDFYKPDMGSEYPTVDGSLSIMCYYEALLSCYSRFRGQSECSSLQSADIVLMHCPFTKLVTKSVALLNLYDSRDNLPEELNDLIVDYSAFNNKQVETFSVKSSADVFATKASSGLRLNKIIGNSYTASLYFSLISASKDPSISGKSVLMFSYGSGYTSSMFRMRFSTNQSTLDKFKTCWENLDVLLEGRQKISAEQYTEMMKQREVAYDKSPYEPVHSLDYVWEGSWYLQGVDDRGRRTYARKMGNN